VDQRKVSSIVGWATQTSCSEVRRFTGLANYYRRFVEGYSEVAAPLTALGSPTACFTWTPEAQASFDALKLALYSAPVLHTFDPARRAVLTMDASNVAILTEPDDEGHQHPVACESHKMTAMERNEVFGARKTLKRLDHMNPSVGIDEMDDCQATYNNMWENFAAKAPKQQNVWNQTRPMVEPLTPSQERSRPLQFAGGWCSLEERRRTIQAATYTQQLERLQYMAD
jgi:hypothetical protein